MSLPILLADLTVVLHALFVLFVTGGQMLILLGWWRRWDWPRRLGFRLAHLAAIGLVVLESWFGIVCPLTWLEYRLRLVAGQTPQDLGFIAYWTRELLFYDAPAWVFTVIYSLFGLLVALAWLAYAPRWRGGR